MDVVDFLIKLLDRVDVAVITTAALPDSSCTMFVDQLVRYRDTKFIPTVEKSFRETELERSQDVGQITAFGFTDEQMSVIWHQDPRIQPKLMPFACSTQLISERIPKFRRCKQVNALVCRECKVPSMVGIVDPFHTQSVGDFGDTGSGETADSILHPLSNNQPRSGALLTADVFIGFMQDREMLV